MSSLMSKFGDGPYTRSVDCALPAHYAELQALCDALGQAAQQEMANTIELGDQLAGERAYGNWLGVRGILRAIEARPDDWAPLEWESLERIDWDDEQFRFPGLEAFDVPRTEPGQTA